MTPCDQDATTTLHLGAAQEIPPGLQQEGKAFVFTDPSYKVGMIHGSNVNITPTMDIDTPAKHLPGSG